MKAIVGGERWYRVKEVVDAINRSYDVPGKYEIGSKVVAAVRSVERAEELIVPLARERGRRRGAASSQVAGIRDYVSRMKEIIEGFVGGRASLSRTAYHAELTRDAANTLFDTMARERGSLFALKVTQTGRWESLLVSN